MTLYDKFQARIVIDFANVRDIQDLWFRFINTPIIENFKVGHQKEAFSLDELTSIKARTFMEKPLPTQAFAPSRNIGINYLDPGTEGRMTWAAGFFLNTSSFGDVGEATSQISDANGFNLTARVTRLLWYNDYGKKLLHLGVSYSHQFRDEERTDTGVQYRARPESRLTDDRLVDTDEFSVKGVDLINVEAAVVLGPLSFQGEYYHTFTDADVEGNLDFWGFYVYGSYFLTGENRNYNISNGTFSLLKPINPFYPRKGGLGAWELGLRFSYVDLNSGSIRGGREVNITAGLSWYLNRKTRFMFNYIRTSVKDREIPPAVDRGNADILQARFQIIF
jgi:phosphate-selective porin OprO/OprP